MNAPTTRPYPGATSSVAMGRPYGGNDRPVGNQLVEFRFEPVM